MKELIQNLVPVEITLIIATALTILFCKLSSDYTERTTTALKEGYTEVQSYGSDCSRWSK